MSCMVEFYHSTQSGSGRIPSSPQSHRGLHYGGVIPLCISTVNQFLTPRSTGANRITVKTDHQTGENEPKKSRQTQQKIKHTHSNLPLQEKMYKRQRTYIKLGWQHDSRLGTDYSRPYCLRPTVGGLKPGLTELQPHPIMSSPHNTNSVNKL